MNSKTYLLGGLLLSLSQHCFADDLHQSPTYDYKLLRYRENYKENEAHKKSPDFWSEYKYIPLTHKPDGPWISLGFDLRDRLESWHNYLFDPNSDTLISFVLERMQTFTLVLVPGIY